MLRITVKRLAALPVESTSAVAISTTGCLAGKGPQIRDYTMPGEYAEHYSRHDTYIDREWWNWEKHKRMHYWAKWRQRRDWVRRGKCEELAPERMRLTALAQNNIMPETVKQVAKDQWTALDKAGAFNYKPHIYAMCQFTSKPRGCVQRYRLNRSIFREMADHGKLAGVQRAKWM